MAANDVAAPAATGDAGGPMTPATVGDVVLTIAAALGQFFRPDLVHLSLAPIAAKHGVSLPSVAQLAGKSTAMTAAGGEEGGKKKGKKKTKKEEGVPHARTGKHSIYSLFVTRLANHASHYGNNPFFKGLADQRPIQMAGSCWHNLTPEQKAAIKAAYQPIMEAINNSVGEGGPKEDAVQHIEAYEKAHPQASLNHILKLKLKDSERTEPPAKKTPGSKGVKPEPAAGVATGPVGAAVAAPAMLPRPVATAAAAAVPLASPAGGKRKAADEDGDADGEGAGGSQKKKKKHKEHQKEAAAAPAAVAADGAVEKKKKKKKKHAEESD